MLQVIIAICKFLRKRKVWQQNIAAQFQFRYFIGYFKSGIQGMGNVLENFIHFRLLLEIKFIIWKPEAETPSITYRSTLKFARIYTEEYIMRIEIFLFYIMGVIGGYHLDIIFLRPL